MHVYGVGGICVCGGHVVCVHVCDQISINGTSPHASMATSYSVATNVHVSKVT